MSRLPVIVAALCMAAGVALAQAPDSPAPSTHPGTRLTFPSSLGGATLEKNNQASTNGRASYAYSINRMQIYVYIFDDGRRVPAGGESPVLMSQFTSEVNQAEQQIKSVGYTRFERPAVPSSCAYGSVRFRCIVYSAHAPEGRRYSKLLMTGYHDSFLKIRIDWSQAVGQTEDDADKALQSFISALVR